MPKKDRVRLIKTPPPGPETRKQMKRETGLLSHGAYGGVSCGLPLYLYLEARQAQALADNAEPRDD
jgi:hypothetical protein